MKSPNLMPTKFSHYTVTVMWLNVSFCTFVLKDQNNSNTTENMAQFSGTEWKNIILNASTMWTTDEDMVEMLIKHKVKPCATIHLNTVDY